MASKLGILFERAIREQLSLVNMYMSEPESIEDYLLCRALSIFLLLRELNLLHVASEF